MLGFWLSLELNIATELLMWASLLKSLQNPHIIVHLKANEFIKIKRLFEFHKKSF